MASHLSRFVISRAFRRSQGAIKGKSVRRTPLEVNVDEDKAETPSQVSAELKTATMSLFFFNVDRVPFLTSISRKILYSTARALKNREHDVVFVGIIEIIIFYPPASNRGPTWFFVLFFLDKIYLFVERIHCLITLCL